MTCLHVPFSRAWHRLHVFASSSDWLIALFASVVIGQSDYFGFSLLTLENSSNFTQYNHGMLDLQNEEKVVSESVRNYEHFPKLKKTNYNERCGCPNISRKQGDKVNGLNSSPNGYFHT